MNDTFVTPIIIIATDFTNIHFTQQVCPMDLHLVFLWRKQFVDKILKKEDFNDNNKKRFCEYLYTINNTYDKCWGSIIEYPNAKNGNSSWLLTLAIKSIFFKSLQFEKS